MDHQQTLHSSFSLHRDQLNPAPRQNFLAGGFFSSIPKLIFTNLFLSIPEKITSPTITTLLVYHFEATNSNMLFHIVALLALFPVVELAPVNTTTTSTTTTTTTFVNTTFVNTTTTTITTTTIRNEPIKKDHHGLNIEISAFCLLVFAFLVWVYKYSCKCTQTGYTKINNNPLPSLTEVSVVN